MIKLCPVAKWFSLVCFHFIKNLIFYVNMKKLPFLNKSHKFGLFDPLRHGQCPMSYGLVSKNNYTPYPDLHFSFYECSPMVKWKLMDVNCRGIE